MLTSYKESPFHALYLISDKAKLHAKGQDYRTKGRRAKKMFWTFRHLSLVVSMRFRSRILSQAAPLLTHASQNYPRKSQGKKKDEKKVLGFSLAYEDSPVLLNTPFPSSETRACTIRDSHHCSDKKRHFFLRRRRMDRERHIRVGWPFFSQIHSDVSHNGTVVSLDWSFDTKLQKLQSLFRHIFFNPRASRTCSRSRTVYSTVYNSHRPRDTFRCRDCVNGSRDIRPCALLALSGTATSPDGPLLCLCSILRSLIFDMHPLSRNHFSILKHSSFTGFLKLFVRAERKESSLVT